MPTFGLRQHDGVGAQASQTETGAACQNLASHAASFGLPTVARDLMVNRIGGNRALARQSASRRTQSQHDETSLHIYGVKTLVDSVESKSYQCVLEAQPKKCNDVDTILQYRRMPVSAFTVTYEQ